MDLDLYTYIRVGRYDLPTPANSTPPAGSDLAEEASAVTWNWDTDTLFVVGDEGTSIVQVSKTGALIDSMTFAGGLFADVEGLAYTGDGTFVVVDERVRTVNSFTYVADTTLEAAAVQSVALGTNAGNLGLEGVALDPQTDGFVLVKENLPQGIFQTTVDFGAGTASNGSPATENSVNLFDPALLGLNDLSDIYALSAIPGFTGDGEDNLIVLSQESGLVLEIERDGTIVSQLVLQSDPGNLLSAVDQGHEGIAVDDDGFLYVVNEQGGGADLPQLWVFQVADFPNAAPTGIALADPLTELAENANTDNRIKLADVAITDDGIGQNTLAVSGPDASLFSVDFTGLYLNPGASLDFETQESYAITVSVDDPAIGAAPDASVVYTLSILDVVNEGGNRAAVITEVAPWASGNSPVGEDWFELTNTGAETLDISAWLFDDDSADFGSADPLVGVTELTPGESAIFLNTNAAEFDTIRSNFVGTWFGGNAPDGLQIGWYDGAGLSTNGDGVYLFDNVGTVQASLLVGASPEASPFATFDNSAGVDGASTNTLSTVGLGGAFAVTNSNGDTEIGSPGAAGRVFVSEAAPWSSGDSPVGEDWFELTNTTTETVSIAGWRFDDDSVDFAASDPLEGITSLAPGESVIFLNVAAAGFDEIRGNFVANWFAGEAPADLQFGYYDGSGLGTGGDAVSLFDSLGNLVTGISFGAATEPPALATFDNASGVQFAEVTTLSAPGFNGAFTITSTAGFSETGSPGSIVTEGVVDNDAPTAVTLENAVTELSENTQTPGRIKLADVAITDDGVGFNALSLSGADADLFEVDFGGLYLKAFTALDFETQPGLQVTVEVDDPTVGETPDATTSFTLTLIDEANEDGPPLRITEVAPWSSGDSPVDEDWFELTNFTDAAVSIAGWSFDDESADFSAADPLEGITELLPRESVIFLNVDGEGFAGVRQTFIDTWFGGSAPADLRFGWYDGAGLGGGGDGVVLFDAAGEVQANLFVGASPEESPFATFDNAAGLNSAEIDTLSEVGTGGAFAITNADGNGEIGSPGSVNSAPVARTDVVSAIGTVPVTIRPLANDSDGDGDALSLVSVVGTPAKGTVAVGEDNTLIYTSTASENANDVVNYVVSDGTDTATGKVLVRVSGPIDETLIGDDTDNLIAAGGGSDRLEGGLGSDFLAGLGGSDFLLGGEGVDYLLGSSGDDLIIGGAGNDVMYGGTGTNVFVFGEGDLGATATDTDQITSFGVLGEDFLDFSAIDAIEGGEDDAFSFIGEEAFSGTAGELRFQQSGAYTDMFGDTNGDGLADIALRLYGAVALDESVIFG